tara:strand:- start:2490 stop:3323 length:834 start_codon:yes stop_codon:yes gene_type:complete
MKLFPSLTNRLKSILNLCFSRNLNGQKIKIPLIHGIKVGLGNEKWMSQVILKVMNVSGGDTFWDVGANLGQTLIKLKTLDSSWHYVGFEPNPTCVYYMQELIKKNSFSRTIILPVGLFTENTVLELETFGDDADPLGSIIPNFRKSRPNSSKKWVPLFSLSAIEEKIPVSNVDIVKIDAEGAEFEVLQTLKSLIVDKRPVVLIEILPVYKKENSSRFISQKKIEAFFKEIDYSIFRINKKNGEFDGFAQINEIGIHGELNMCDYLVCPTEKAKSFNF